jgi:hypothetical protein
MRLYKNMFEERLFIVLSLDNTITWYFDDRREE